MKIYIAALAVLLTFAGTARAANAASPYGALKPAASTDTFVHKTHRLHRSCQLGRGGWHRSYIWGRTWCRPYWTLHKHRHYKKHWQKRHWHKKHRWNRYH